MRVTTELRARVKPRPGLRIPEKSIGVRALAEQIPGSAKSSGEAIRLHAPVAQLRARAKDERASLEQGYQGVAQIIGGVETES